MIGLFGGTCNNMYVFAKVLSDNNYTIKFIEDRGENFPHSQPVWDDVDVFFQSGFSYQNIDWIKFEAEHSWHQPSWYFRPEGLKGGEKYIFKQSPSPFYIRYLACRYLRSYKEAYSIFKLMSNCDYLIVCGIKASILAMLTGKPYMIVPHGSDTRVAIGAERKGKGLKGKVIDWLVAKSFRCADVIGSSLPDGSAEVPKSEHHHRLNNLIIERVPLPYISEVRLSEEERRKKLTQLMTEFGINIPHAKYYCFSPSRINFHWKGHDRLLRAIKNHGHQIDIHFIFLGWGDDYLEANDYIDKHKLHESVTVLPVFLSKQRLMSFFKSVDFIVDALNGSGSYGTSLSEAMSVGCPVVSWISDMFDRPGWSRPPVIHAQTEEELGQTMISISNGNIDLDEESKRVVEWFHKVHDSGAVLRVLDEKISEALS